MANSWQQTPAGFVVRNGRAELTSFAEAVFNPSTMIRYFHTVDAALDRRRVLHGGRGRVSTCSAEPRSRVREESDDRRGGLRTGRLGARSDPLGHEHARQVAQTQPEKFAAIEGLYTSRAGAPLVFFAVPTHGRPTLHGTVEIPGLLSWMAFGDPQRPHQGDQRVPARRRPAPVADLRLVPQHGGARPVLHRVMAVAAIASGQRDALGQPGAPASCCSGPSRCRWSPASSAGSPPRSAGSPGSSTGLRTSQAASITVSAGEILFSHHPVRPDLLALGALYVYLLPGRCSTAGTRPREQTSTAKEVIA